MELRHLRYFIAVAEELSFTRAAERLNIEQSPVSRAIKELEDDLGVRLFYRDRRGTRLTQAGAIFLEDTRRIFTTLDHAKTNVKAVYEGYRGSLHIAVSCCSLDPRLADFLTRCREDDPEIDIQLSEVPLCKQLCGLRSGDYSIGFSHTEDVGSGLVAEPVWVAPIVAALPARHPLLIHKEVPIEKLADFPLVLCQSQNCDGYCRELSERLSSLGRDLNMVERVDSWDIMMTLVAAGYGIGFASAVKLANCKHPSIVIRPLALKPVATVTTFLVRVGNGTPSASLERFIARLHAKDNEADIT